MKRLYHTTLLVILALCSFALTVQAQKAYVGLEYQMSYSDVLDAGLLAGA